MLVFGTVSLIVECSFIEAQAFVHAMAFSSSVSFSFYILNSSHLFASIYSIDILPCYDKIQEKKSDR